ncbi:MAG TPA: hypothetical protein VHB97_03290 [Polyangia bacterium]|nr:hypothetical protein [Polyangia bacterium]
MLAFGLTLIVSVAATPPPAVHAGEKLASTYDEASCDAADGGECADEVLIDLTPPPAAILDCQSPFIAEMIGSCDLPRLVFPSLHVATLQKAGNGFIVITRNGSTEHLQMISAPSSVDAALPLAPFALAPSIHATLLHALASTITQDVPPSRLDRPPRA